MKNKKLARKLARIENEREELFAINEEQTLYMERLDDEFQELVEILVAKFLEKNNYRYDKESEHWYFCGL